MRQQEPAATAAINRDNALCDVLATGLGATVAMWGVGYLCRLPGLHTPAAWIFAFVVLSLLVAGFVLGARPTRGGGAGLAAGAVAGLCNLLILFSLMGGKDGDRPPPDVLRAGLIWAPACVAICALLTALGTILRRVLPLPRSAASSSPAAVAAVTAVATMILLSVGGVVTGFEAGLAVPDWPNSYGYNMFLFPLARMTGGIYFEHSHRLFGALVGLSTVALAVCVWRAEPRRWVRDLSLLAVAMVVVQGVLGGLRVTGKLTLSQSQADLAPQVSLAVIHGVFGQVFFATLLALWAMLSRTWRCAPPPRRAPAAGTDLVLSIVAPAVLLAQLVLGALLRHYQWGMEIHVGFAVAVLAVVGLLAIRTWSLYDGLPIIGQLGQTVLIVLLIQLALGGAALLAVLGESGVAQPGPLQVLITTAHQTTGALLLGLTVCLGLWLRRLAAREDSAQAADWQSQPAEPRA